MNTFKVSASTSKAISITLQATDKNFRSGGLKLKVISIITLSKPSDTILKVVIFINKN